ncbi:MAG: Tim44/TimA family putative adaptor protein [Pseudomonas marincola]
MGDGFQFLDIILLVMIAAFIFLRLRNVLGRRTGHEQPPQEEISQKTYEDPDSVHGDEALENVVPLKEGIDIEPQNPAQQTPMARALREIHDLDRNFNPDTFASQAEMAYEAIVEAFAKGDRRVLGDLLSEEVYNNFCSAIDTREKAEEAMSTDILSIEKSEVTAAELKGSEAEITVHFETDMISVTTNEEGVVVNGDPHPHMVKEYWTFARDLKSRNPNWLLIMTRSAE